MSHRFSIFFLPVSRGPSAGDLLAPSQTIIHMSLDFFAKGSSFLISLWHVSRGTHRHRSCHCSQWRHGTRIESPVTTFALVRGQPPQVQNTAFNQAFPSSAVDLPASAMRTHTAPWLYLIPHRLHFRIACFRYHWNTRFLDLRRVERTARRSAGWVQFRGIGTWSIRLPSNSIGPFDTT